MFSDFDAKDWIIVALVAVISSIISVPHRKKLIEEVPKHDFAEELHSQQKANRTLLLKIDKSNKLIKKLDKENKYLKTMLVIKHGKISVKELKKLFAELED